MKVLYIAVEAIYPTNTGSRIRAYQLVKALSQKHEVGLAYISAEKMEDAEAIGCQYIEQISLATPLSQLGSSQKATYLLKAITQNSFPLSQYYLGSQQVDAIIEVIAHHQPEVVVLQSSYLLPIAKEIKMRFPRIQLVLDAHNIESLLQSRMANTASSTLMKPVKSYVAANLARMEKSAGRYVSGIAAVSEEEAKWFQQHNTSVRVAVVANGVDVDYFTTRHELPQEPVIAFCGSMSYLPNHTGVMWFAEHVWPLIVAETPEAQWLIIGKDPPQNVQDLAADAHITVTGTVEDVREWLEKSRLSIVPLLSGGGTRLKILDAMSMQRVVISTHLGAEGIIDAPGIIRVDDPQKMANAIMKTLHRKDLVEMGKQNRAVAIKHYSWSAIGLQMVSLVEECAHQVTSS